jgi:hypothetical protein
MEQVAHLKEKFEMGHGHANALVAVFRQKNGLQGDSSSFQNNLVHILVLIDS